MNPVDTIGFTAAMLAGPVLLASTIPPPAKRSLSRPLAGDPAEASKNRQLVRLTLLGGAVAAAWLVSPMMALVLVPCAVAWPRLKSRSERKRMDNDHLAALPETLDLVAVVVGSGGTVSEAVRVLQVRARPAVRPALVDLERQRQAGQSLASVLAILPDRLGDGYRPLIRALLATERDGAPVSTLLVRLAEESEARRKREVEAKAKRLSVQLIFPLVTCFLPAVLLGAIVPLIAVSAGHLLR